MIRVLPLLLITLLLHAADEYSWQNSHATVLPTGELQLKQEPYVFKAGKTVRYIDYESGKDSNAGSKDAPWQHHPWDKNARDKAAAFSGICTYVFKGGVTYRGRLFPDDHGSAEEPIRLTRDPSWGTGPAVLVGSRKITDGWKRGADHEKIPNKDQVWHRDIDMMPRRIYQVDKQGKAEPIVLARDPNWTATEPSKRTDGWYRWENPKFWEGNNKTKIDGRNYHRCIDSKHIKGKKEDWIDAVVHTEYGPVMGNPFPSTIKDYDEEANAIIFGGPWTYFGSEDTWTDHRYYLENKPRWLDSPGEFYFQIWGKNKGRLYIRLPNDADPNQAHIEIGEHISIIEAKELRHVHISGLDFRYTGFHYQYGIPSWAHPDLKGAAIRMTGGGDDIRIHHCNFTDLMQAIRYRPTENTTLKRIDICDNNVLRMEHGAFRIGPKRPSNEKPFAYADKINILRNNIRACGFQALSGEHGHTISINGRDVHIAGNFISDVAAAGIQTAGTGENTLLGKSRYLIHHNRIERALSQACDWGGIYINQHGGNALVWSNIVIDPIGRMPARPGRFIGLGYYMDGGYKCYLFNNFAIGGPDQTNKAAFKSMVSFQNMIFNNTVHGWSIGSNRQSPHGSRERYLGNIFSDVHKWLFEHTRPAKGEAAANAAHEVKADNEWRYETMAYGNNAFSGIEKSQFGVFEKVSVNYKDLESFSAALAKRGTQVASVGEVSTDSIIRDPANKDWRPKTDAISAGKGVRFFVPWGLARCVGEWNFTPRADDPSNIIDEHWFRTGYYGYRDIYHLSPRYPITVAGISKNNYKAGPLEDWCNGTLELSAKQYGVISHAHLAKPYTSKNRKGVKQTVELKDKHTVDIATGDLLIEVYFKPHSTDGLLLGKQDDQAGYELNVKNGKLVLNIKDNDGQSANIEGPSIANNIWQHLLIEIDRDTGVHFHLDGKTTTVSDKIPTGSLSTQADFLLAGGPDKTGLAMSIDFLRIAKSTLADMETDIHELRAWQFDGPQFRDFAGVTRGDDSHAGALSP